MAILVTYTTCGINDTGCELGGCIAEPALLPADTIDSLVTFDSTLVDGNIFLSATSHLESADSGILHMNNKG